jgi:hypothetical protein
MEDFITYKHMKSSVKTFGDFVDQDGLSIAFRYYNDEKSLLNFAPKGKKSNLENILSQYSTVVKKGETKSEYDKWKNNKNYKNFPLKVGTIIYIPKTKLQKSTLVGETIGVVESADFNKFLTDEQIKIQNDINEVKKIVNTKNNEGIYSSDSPNCTVYAWVRALSSENQEKGELKGSWINLTPFVQDLNTSVGYINSSFSIELDNITADNINTIWSTASSKIYKYGKDSDQYYSSHHDVVPNADNPEETVLSNYYFHNIINENDLVFIKFEKDGDFFGDSFEIDPIQITGEQWDMIGLVDSNSLSTAGANAFSSVNIQGRDLLKGLSDDGCYFYPEEYAGGAFVNNQDDDRLIKRIFGSLETLGAYIQRSIGFSTQFILNQLSNTGLVPNETFEAYGDRRNQRFSLDQEKSNQVRKTHEPQRKAAEDEVKKAVVNFYEGINPLYPVDVKKTGKDTLTTELRDFNQRITEANKYNVEINQQNQEISKEIEKQFDREIVDYLDVKSIRLNEIRTSNRSNPKKIIDKRLDDYKKYLVDKIKESVENRYDKSPFSEQDLNEVNGVDLIRFQSPNLTDNVPLNARSRPELQRTLNALDATLKEAEKLADEVYKKIEDYKKTLDTIESEELKLIKPDLMDGIYQIFNLVIDKTADDRRIVDSSIATSSGSIINFFNRIADGVFIEMFGDTYGDEYYLTFRQPPFNRKAYEDLAVDAVVVTADETFGTNLSFDQRVFSWYSLRPQGLFMGEASKVSLAFLPAIYFSEFAAIWGSKPLDISTNYIPYIPEEGTEKQKTLNFFLRQAYRDLKYLIDANCYLPFTRTGTLSIKLNRAIKVGSMIYFAPTQEYFYVNGVSHDYSISEGSVEWSTTLSVERGMVAKNVFDEKYSYFNICQTEFGERFFENLPPKEPTVEPGIEVESVILSGTDSAEITIFIDGLTEEELQLRQISDELKELEAEQEREDREAEQEAELLKEQQANDESKNLGGRNVNNVPVRAVEILKDWRVNKDVFNYFLKRRQFAK